MIYFSDFQKAASLYTEKNINKIIIPLSLDTMANCQLYRSLSGKYQDLDEKFAGAVGSRVNNVGDFIKVQVNTGHIIYFIIIRGIEKFQPYILDVTKVITKVMANIERDGTEGAVLFPMPTSDELKLSDTIFIPAICNALMHSKINVYILSNGDHENYINSVEETYISYKQDSWKSDWMLSFDDVIFLAVLQSVVVMAHDFKLSKNNLVKAYRVCCNHGMFPKIEWYETPFGPFFKMFLPKSNSLINHGLLLNTFHYSNAEPKKFSCSLGPYIPHLYHLAYSFLGKNREKIQLIANDLRKEHIKSYQKNEPEPEPTSQTQFSL